MPTKRDTPRDEVASYEKELAGYLQERIRPGLNSGSIPMLARSIAKEIAHRDHPNGTPDDDDSDEQPRAEDVAGDEAEEEEVDEAEAEGDDEAEAEGDEPASEFENEMFELQEELGDDWIVRFSVQGDDAWLTAEKDDGSQRVESPVADVLREAVALINEGGGRSS
jgi:hypothetical protein